MITDESTPYTPLLTQELSANVHFILFSIVLCIMDTEEDFGFDTSEIEVPVSSNFKFYLIWKVSFLRKSCFIYIISIE